MSILVMTTMTGTFRARAMPRCSLVCVRPISGEAGIIALRRDLLAHTNQAIVCRYHEEAIIWAAAKEAKDCGSKVALVTSEISKADDFGLI